MNQKTKNDKRVPPSIDWSNFTEGEISSAAIGTPILCIALDTEYQSNYTANTNLCLSYQFAALDLLTGTYKTGILYMNIREGQRLTFSEFTRKVLEKMGIKASSLKDSKIIYVAHFFSAEWSMFKDRKELYMKFEYIRKTLVTTNRSLKTTIKDENDQIVNFWVDVRDTMLLLPEGYKSLESASTFIKGYEKIELPDNIKSNMYQFLQDEPELFEEYAIRDVEVTLKLFFKLQYLLNKINGTELELYTTLSSATTISFKNFSRSKFSEIKLESVKDSGGEKAASSLIYNMQFDRFHSLYKKYESLADRGYMGGLNSSYYMGYCSGYTFLDIDFKNAYPTAMNLIKIGDFGEKLVPTKKLSKNISLEELTND